MPERIWGPTGVVGLSPYHISRDVRDHILEIVNELTPHESSKFIKELEAATSNYEADRRLVERSRPAAIRKNLDNCLKKVHGLVEAVNKLDGNSKSIIGENASLAELDVHISFLFETFRLARETAEKIGSKSGGRLREPHKLWFAVNVADCLEKYTSTKVTSIDGGPYVSVLALLFGAVHRTTVKAACSIAEKALRNRSILKLRNPEGLLEYHPLPNEEIN